MVIKKKTKNSFVRSQSDRFMRVGASWRKPRGIDSPTRRRFRGSRPMVSIGFRNPRDTRYQLANGRYKYIVHNKNGLESMIMHKDKFAFEIAHSVSTKSRVEILKHAESLGMFITNRRARVEKAANV